MEIAVTYDEPPSSNEKTSQAQARSLRERVVSLEKQIRARSQVALAQGLLMGRYGLADPEEAFALMRTASQRANIKLHQIATALVTTTAPAVGAPVWFPDRTRTAAPSLADLRAGTLDARNQGQVLDAALSRVLEVSGGDAGNAQLAEGGVLRMERHMGHPQAFTDYFAFVEDGTSCSRAAHVARQVTVRDIAVTDVFDEETRQVILESGSRACHSVPLSGPDGTVRGVISSHHDRPVTGFARTQLAAFDQVRQVVGEWLQWYRGTVVLDALEDLHHSAVTRS
ncbi:ANTAR domain-containing protein [Streptomyces sp. NPDC051576]|uniref:ANTAR domain-containing protein n=1 Tax=Streptomyces sp. NPDC051576 TaxID=3155803 RepID=UPI0034166A21